MKKPGIFLVIILIAFSCKAQLIPQIQIIPVEDVIDYIDIEENAYIKDVNNVFADYLGTWTGTTENKNYTFIISKITTEPDYDNIKQDILIMKYIITHTTTNVEIEDSTNIPNVNAPCRGMYFRQFSGNSLSYQFFYGGENYSCGQNGRVYITLKNNNTQMFLSFSDFFTEYYEEDCLTGPAEQVMPEVGVLLTKQ